MLSNALKFVPEENGTIYISVHKAMDLVQITIEENGKGIPAEDAPFIFERFYQSKDQNRHKPQGSGLGLAISKKIMQRHAGDIELDSDFNEGARFIVWLPIKSAQ